MITIPESIKQQINNPQPAIKQFVDVITGRTKPTKIHIVELFADQEVMQWITEEIFEKKWVPIPSNPVNIDQMKEHLLCEIQYWYRMGYDYILVTGGVDFGNLTLRSDDSSEDMNMSTRQWANMSTGLISSWQDFEATDWPVVTDKDVWMYQFVADNLPEGMGIFACPTSGFLEIPMEYLIGYETMSMMSFDNPDLLEAVFTKVRNAIMDVYRKVVGIDKVAGFFQGDDMGYKTGLLMSPEFLKQYSLPGHKEAADLAHSKGKLYMLHSCGLLEKIMDYLIDEVKIDAKHSYEDAIIPVESFYQKYSERIAVLGGVDVDLLGRASEEQVCQRISQSIESCHQRRFGW